MKESEKSRYTDTELQEFKEIIEKGTSNPNPNPNPNPSIQGDIKGDFDTWISNMFD